MSLKKGYINKKKFSIHISKRKMCIGGFLGIIFSIVFYAFIKLISKSLVVFDAILHNYELIILSENKQAFYSFFIAFIAVNFAFSVIFTYLIDTPKIFLGKYNYKRKNILNLQRVTNWFFLNWFCRMAFMFGILALSFASDDFFSDINYLIYLLIIVFLGQMWMSVRCFFVKNKAKYFLLFISSLLLITFTISKIEFLNNEALNTSLLSQNILYKHKINRVTSEEFQVLTGNKSFLFNLYLKENEGGFIIETEGINQFMESKSLSEKINIFKKRFPKALEPYINYILHIDKDLNMSYVKKTQHYLKEKGANRINYSLEDKEYPFFVRGNKTFGFTISDCKSETLESKAIKITILENGKFYFQKDLLSKKELRRSIIKELNKEGFSPFVISFDANTSFEAYFEIISLTKNIVNEFRNDYSKNEYNKEYNSLSIDSKKSIKEKFYWVFIDDLGTFRSS